MEWSASLDTGGVVGPAQEATAALRAMREETEAASGALGDLGSKAVGPLASGAKASGAPGAAAKKASPPAAKAPEGGSDTSSAGKWAAFAKGADKAYGKKSERASSEGGADKALAALGKQQEREKAAREKEKAAEKERKRTAQASSVSGLAGKALGLAGVAGAAATAFDVTKIAIGYKAMAQMQGIVARTSIGFRQLFTGVDPAPLVRALDRFSKNFTSQTVMGRALGDVLTRSFNGIFAAVEKLEPYVTAFGQGMVLAFLYAENAVLRARVALAPYTGALDGLISSTSLMRVAAIGGGIALAIGAGYAVAAAAPFLALAAAILAVTAAFEQASKLQKEWDGSAFWNKIKSDIGVNSQADNEKALGITVGSDKAAPAAAGAKGSAVGAAMGAGIVGGLDGSNPAIAAAGARAADAAVKGAKTAAEIHSPSARFRREVGRQMGAGTALGMEDTEDRIQRAAASSMVPDLKLGGGGGRGAVSITGPLVSIGQIVVQGAEELHAEVRRVVDDMAAQIAETVGLPAPARS